jgi:hypothetical protein
MVSLAVGFCMRESPEWVTALKCNTMQYTLPRYTYIRQESFKLRFPYVLIRVYQRASAVTSFSPLRHHVFRLSRLSSRGIQNFRSGAVRRQERAKSPCRRLL